MDEINLWRLTAHDRILAEEALAVRYRPDDGHSGSATLAEMILSDRFAAKAVRAAEGLPTFGLMMNWPGLCEAQFMSVPKAVWDCVDLPLVEEVRDG